MSGLIRYALYRNNKSAITVHSTIMDAQNSAKECIKNKEVLAIKTVTRLAPARTWIFDYTSN